MDLLRWRKSQRGKNVFGSTTNLFIRWWLGETREKPMAPNISENFDLTSTGHPKSTRQNLSDWKRFFLYFSINFSLSWDLWPVSRTFRDLFGPEKPVVKLKSAFFKKLIFLHVFNVRKDKRIAESDGFQPRRCEDVKGIMTPKIDLKSFGTFEGRTPDQSTFTCFWVDWIWLVTHDGKVSSLSLSAASAVIDRKSVV